MHFFLSGLLLLVFSSHYLGDYNISLLFLYLFGRLRVLIWNKAGEEGSEAISYGRHPAGLISLPGHLQTPLPV
ncbi:uncharacterized protein V2V93DRAFT_367612 [Kockiozyma suomiensis]|uniref:uncharacterized protein n=1 Tax=Kockiozyma suomiensis TaxID=1337062 RepID=UPI003343356E